MTVLTPSAYEALVDAILKSRHRILVDCILFTGMRYTELLHFSKHLTWFDEKNRCITIPEAYTKTFKGRTVHLTPAFTKELAQYLREFKSLVFPIKQGMTANLQRWWAQAQLPPPAPSPKIFRKSWESWLLKAGYDGMQVALSQGHSTLISYAYYAQLPAELKSEHEKVLKYTEGWGE